MLDPAAMDGNDPETIRFPADTHAIAVAVAAAHAFAARHRLDEESHARLAIVVEELVTNLVEHGDAPGTPINLALVQDGGGVRIALSDRGTPFDPRDAVTSDLPPERGGGAGLLLVLTWTSVESYDSFDGVNRLLLLLPTKRLSDRLD